MSSEASLFRPIFVPDELRDALSARAWLQAMLDAERALWAATGVDGLAPSCDAALYVDYLGSAAVFVDRALTMFRAEPR